MVPLPLWREERAVCSLKDLCEERRLLRVQFGASSNLQVPKGREYPRVGSERDMRRLMSPKAAVDQ